MYSARGRVEQLPPSPLPLRDLKNPKYNERINDNNIVCLKTMVVSAFYSNSFTITAPSTTSPGSNTPLPSTYPPGVPLVCCKILTYWYCYRLAKRDARVKSDLQSSVELEQEGREAETCRFCGLHVSWMRQLLQPLFLVKTTPRLWVQQGAAVRLPLLSSKDQAEVLPSQTHQKISRW